MSRSVLAVAIASGVTLTSSSARAIFYPVAHATPLARLLANVDEVIARQPGNPKAHFLAARLHAIAFIWGKAQVCFERNDEGTLPTFYDLVGVSLGEPFAKCPTGQLESLPDAEQHLAPAEHHFRRALEIDLGNALYRLGYASLLEGVAKRTENPADRERARLWYLLAFRAALSPAARSARARPSEWLGAEGDRIAWTAAGRYLALTPRDERERDPAPAIAEAFKRLDGQHAVIETPIVIPVRGDTRPASLAQGPRAIPFDMHGDGELELGTWIPPDWAFLIWDPQGDGEVTSGRQLLGSLTFGMLWRDGYDVLDALDDDHDGRLAGPELQGLRVWGDRNADGGCDEGETASLDALSIAWLATHSTSHWRTWPFNPQGIGYADGRVGPSVDWIRETRAAEVRDDPRPDAASALHRGRSAEHLRVVHSGR